MGANPFAAWQLAGARAAGLITAGYIWIPPDTTIDTSQLIRVARAAASAEEGRLSFIALDIEDPQHRRLHPTDPQGRLQNAIAQLGSAKVVIYTSRSMWTPIMAGSTAFAGCPLWDADYDRGEDLDATFRPYGGWTSRAMLQYKGTTAVAGISADLNVADLERLGITAGPAPVPNPYPLGLSLLTKRFADIVEWYPLNQAEQDKPDREALSVAAWQELYDQEVAPRLHWMQRE
jgi:hypothetical protein